jgi:tRNA-binding EMAP/Myf-like protein
MPSHNIRREPGLVRPSADQVVVIDPEPTSDADTAGQSMLKLKLARAIDADRVPEAQKLSHHRVHVREASSDPGDGFLKRLRRR